MNYTSSMCDITALNCYTFPSIRLLRCTMTSYGGSMFRSCSSVDSTPSSVIFTFKYINWSQTPDGFKIHGCKRVLSQTPSLRPPIHTSSLSLSPTPSSPVTEASGDPPRPRWELTALPYNPLLARGTPSSCPFNPTTHFPPL